MHAPREGEEELTVFAEDVNKICLPLFCETACCRATSAPFLQVAGCHKGTGFSNGNTLQNILRFISQQFPAKNALVCTVPEGLRTARFCCCVFFTRDRSTPIFKKISTPNAHVLEGQTHPYVWAPDLFFFRMFFVPLLLPCVLTVLTPLP